MNLMRWNPSYDWGFLKGLDGVFGDFMRPGLAAPSFRPALEVTEDEDGYTVQAEAPGVAREDLKVMLDGDVLTISGERCAEEKKESASVIIQVFDDRLWATPGEWDN